jgi:hypothetical protein
VTIFLQDGDFTSNGDATINLVGPPSRNCTNCPPAVPGVLIYMAESNEGEVQINGNALTDFTGTVYVPKGTIDVGGTADSLNLHTQFIGNTVKVHGNAAINISYDEEDVYLLPAKLELFK